MSTFLLNKILPYVYKLTHKETGQFYIGFRKANKVNSNQDLGLKYFSSSSRVKKLGFENFNIEILAEFFNWEDALNFEQNTIKENFTNNLCLNRYYNINDTYKFGMQSYGKENPFYGRKHSQESKDLLSLNKSGINHPRSIPVIVNGIIFITITNAAKILKYDKGDLSKILKGQKNLNKRIWQAEYF